MIGKITLHRKRQDIQLELKKKPFLNTSMKPLVIGFAYDCFFNQLDAVSSNI